MVTKNSKTDKLSKDKVYAKGDTSFSSFWLYNHEKDIMSKHFKDSFVNFYDDKELLSEFNPTLAKNIISYWSEPNDLIFDPFSGRTRSFVAYAMNRMYVGCEVSLDVVDYMFDKFEEMSLFSKEDFNVDIIHDDCINIKEHYTREFDMIFTCPPYWNLEKYQSVKGQLSDITNYNTFLLELKKRLDLSLTLLKKNGYMCLVVGDFRKNKEYITFHSDIINMMKENKSIKLHDVITVQNIPFGTAAYYFGTHKKNKITAKAHEYILVYKKTETFKY